MLESVWPQRNAILIVEFAKEELREGKTSWSMLALEGARLRFASHSDDPPLRSFSVACPLWNSDRRGRIGGSSDHGDHG